MSGRSASWLAWSACALSLALTALSLLLLSLTLLHSDTPVYYYWLETSMVAVGYSTVGAIVAGRLAAANPTKERQVMLEVVSAMAK